MDQRFYASSYGRFLTTDPENGGYTDDPGSLNAYIYANGDPVNANDLLGGM